MKCKAFDVGIELEIQAVTCPGVWLCPNGQVTVQIYLLGLCSQTSTMNPAFPLLCHEKFTFNKTFSNLNNLFDLDTKMRKELVYMELIQWEDCDRGNVLATFKTSLSELLYPFPKRKGLLPGVDVDLLMEATSKFPGIIAPKLEISTKMTINEVLCTVKDKQNDVYAINPKLISSKCIPRRKVPLHQKKVCHSHRYHNSKQRKSNNKKNVTDFTNNLLDCDHMDNCSPKTSKRLLAKKVSNEYHIDNDNNLEKDFVAEKVKQLRKSGAEMECRCEETKIRCPLCEKYKCVFSEPCRCEFMEDQAYLRRNSRNEEIKEFTANEHSENEKRNSRHEPAQRNDSRTELNSPKSIDFYKDKHMMRLDKAHSSPTYFSLDTKNSPCDDESCTDKFYKNLEEFYKKLYMRAHYKLKNERCKCKK